MYSNGHTPQQPQQRHRRSDRYAAPQGNTQPPPQGWQQSPYPNGRQAVPQAQPQVPQQRITGPGIP